MNSLDFGIQKMTERFFQEWVHVFVTKMKVVNFLF